MADDEEREFHKKKRKDRVLSNMKFIGNLFLKNHLSAKVIGHVIQDLVCISAEQVPEEPMVECICELLKTIGYTLEQSANGKASLISVCGRLKDLMNTKVKDKSGRDVPKYSRRIQFAIQDIQDMKSNGWKAKIFKEQAKKMQDVKADHDRQARAKGPIVSETVVAGKKKG